MKSRFLIFTSLVLAVLCLGSASNAMAQSVTGGGVANFGGGPPLYFAVSARIGASGPEGTMIIGAQGDHLGATVVDLCVFENRAFVTGQITRSTFDFAPVGSYVIYIISDNGNSGDGFLPLPAPSPVPCFDFGSFSGGITNGNFTVTP